jgi:LysR family glycine cleavage system transcriptional activator
VDVAIRFGRGAWPGLRADWLMAEDIFPVCSPALLAGPVPLRSPADLAHHTLLYVDYQRDEWQLWLTAAGVAAPETRGQTQRGQTQRSLTFDLSILALQAAVDGLGVAIGHRSYVEADLAAGRLVAPFELSLPSEAGFYVVCPEALADVPDIAAFRSWLLANAGSAGQQPGDS